MNETGYSFSIYFLLLTDIVASVCCGTAGILPAIVRVFFPAILMFWPASCMYFCLQKHAFMHASRGQICMSSACKTTCKMPVVFR